MWAVGLHDPFIENSFKEVVTYRLFEHFKSLPPNYKLVYNMPPECYRRNVFFFILFLLTFHHVEDVCPHRMIGRSVVFCLGTLGSWFAIVTPAFEQFKPLTLK